MLEAYLVNRQWIAERLSHLSAPRSVSSSLKASQSITETREHQWSITSIARHHGCTENETLIRIRCQVTRQRSWHFACDYINFLLLPTPPRISDFCLCQRLFSFFAGLFLVRMLESLQIRAKYIWSFEHVPDRSRLPTLYCPLVYSCVFYLFPCSGPFHIVHHIIRRQLCQSTPWVLGLNRAHVWAGSKAS